MKKLMLIAVVLFAINIATQAQTNNATKPAAQTEVAPAATPVVAPAHTSEAKPVPVAAQGHPGCSDKEKAKCCKGKNAKKCCSAKKAGEAKKEAQ